MIRFFLACVALLLPVAAAAQESQRGLRAERYDVGLTVLLDGSVEVDEEVIFTFSERDFTRVDRKIPSRRLDGFIDVHAWMDDGPMAEGSGPGRVRIDRTGRLDVRWQFAALRGRHSFRLRYRALGVLEAGLNSLSLRWTALPSDRRYAIDSSKITIMLPAGVDWLGTPAVAPDTWAVARQRGSMTATAAGLGSRDTALVSGRMSADGMAAAAPRWQYREERARELLPAFIAGAATLLVTGIGVLIMMRLRYPRPAVEQRSLSPASYDALPPGLATAMPDGRVAIAGLQAHATFFDLARRGVVSIKKTAPPGRLRSPRFDVTVHPGGHLADHERVVVDALRSREGPLDLTQAWRVLGRRLREFKRVAREELAARGLMDRDRAAAAQALTRSALVLVLLAVVALLVVGLTAGDYGGGPMLVPAAIVVSGVMLLIAGQMFPTLTSEGAARAAEWALRRKALRQANADSARSADECARWLPFAVGFGIGKAWVKGLPASVVADPAALPWLHAAGQDRSGALVAIVATSGTAATGAGSSGGAAGGGSSSAG